MALRNVITCGNPLLKKRVSPCDEQDPILKDLVADMFETMYENRGVGLAAPQIGFSISLFVINYEWSDDEKKPQKGVEEVFINPKILKSYGKYVEHEEGCLSVPEIREQVRRKDTIDIEYTSLEGERKLERSVTGMRARVIQHEYDHLQGILFIDRLPPSKKIFIQKELQRIFEEAN